MISNILFDLMYCHFLFQGSIPFAVIGSNSVTDVRGKQVRVRQYPWGMAEGIYSGTLFSEYMVKLSSR